MNNEKVNEQTGKVAKMKVKILNIQKGLKTYDNVSIIKIKSKKYNLSIMEDYLPVIGEINGDVEIISIDNFVKLTNIIGYYMLKHNEFKLFIKEE
ncbi:MAG: hypothetical protein ACLSW4_07055 [Clostridia bacterium]|mgnify:FL=1|jgi:hypothetical protein